MATRTKLTLASSLALWLAPAALAGGIVHTYESFGEGFLGESFYHNGVTTATPTTSTASSRTARPSRRMTSDDSSSSRTPDCSTTTSPDTAAPSTR